ncbi:MAG: NAD-dependent epimerase/dehydratase family protein [Firmicutes bacterium]|nr:NAD-dependent epimerase/dehydratase family protein [Bacillota bacterium]
MKILITGSKGFIGKNLVSELSRFDENTLYLYDLDSTIDELEKYTRDCDFVFHLAGVNRPKTQGQFSSGNIDFTSFLISKLTENKNFCPIMFSSSIQAELENPYGKSKKKAEELISLYGETTGSKVMIYRFPNVFGKWCKPNYNSVVATFSYNISHNLDITINDRSTMLDLVYIDDVIRELLNALHDDEFRHGKYCYAKPEYRCSLGELANKLVNFRENRNRMLIPSLPDDLTKKLYATYLSYISYNDLAIDLNMHIDHRGSFTEIFKSNGFGQISVNISHPGIIKGNHWHHTKNEKFLVVYGQGLIRIRDLNKEYIAEFFVNGENLRIIDIPPGATHNIENVGDTDLVTIIWASEEFNPEFPDTNYLEV